MALTDMQKRYIWLAGSHPNLVVQQGRGVRGLPLYFAPTEETLWLFGYSSPLLWLVNRGLFVRLQDNISYALTDAGEQEFTKLKVLGFINRVEETTKRATLRGKA